MMKRRPRTAPAAALVLVLSLSASALAYHSSTVFFSADKSLVSVSGKVSDFDFKNTHGLIRLEVRDASGTVGP